MSLSRKFPFLSFCLPSERLFERSLLREFTSMAAGVFFVLLAIVVVTRGAKLLGLAAGGRVASEAIAALLGFVLLGIVPWLLSLTVFITVLMTLTRAWRDREMDIWFAAGQPLTAWVRPVLIFAVPMALLSASLSLGMTPWAKQKSREYREQLATRDDMSALAPGMFKESSRADRVYFIENFSGDGGAARNIFVQSREGERQTVTIAEQGYLMSHPDGERILVLQNGRRYDGVQGQADYRVIEFAEARVRVEEGDRRTVGTATEAKTTLALLGSADPEEQGELAWRIAIPISAILLALVAVPLAYVNPRVGRTFNLLIAVLLFSIYLNLINLGQSWIAAGRLPSWIGIWPVHLVVGGIAYALFRWRSKART
ncbi:LPS export ABC transporter permease LptF [Chitinimonas taiwanensis]|uniref:Lipopolysaccharide export system permease protein LptF n=1 Tax=Chitinimonas taiwanensis DSM 18899 TaxID=1121279 RepID=A0A1K2HDU6_9NEIS|nr:LPS export ABC transporter permease LptF [Chitinimonas taiwanensis]SFZ74673.1 lipopolysaccharide export system permease protein [Chitinimonas taiwanensis DSM 18899]